MSTAQLAPPNKAIAKRAADNPVGRLRRWLQQRADREQRREERRYRRDLARTLKKEAKWYVPIVVNTAARLGIDHYLRRSSQPGMMESLITGRSARERLHVMEVRANEQALFIRIDPTRLPYRVSIEDLRAQEVIDTLSLACRRDVEFHASPKSGVWYVVNRDEALRQIPKMFSYRDAWAYLSQTEQMRTTPYPPLYFVAGVTQNGRIVSGDLERMRHVLTAGVTGSGKSVMVNNILCTLLMRNSPERLRVWAFDMKGGMELHDYKEVPHLDRLVIEPEDMAPALKELHNEVERRQRLLMAGKARDIVGYNYQHRNDQLPYILAVIDELADVMLFERLAGGNKSASDYLARILAKGRAVGVFVLLSTQTPSRGVVTPLIKNNVPAKIAFACATIAHSVTVIDSKDAFALSPRGRAILNDGGNVVEIQAPFIKPREIQAAVQHVIKKYTGVEPNKPFDNLDILRYGRDNLGGALPTRELFDHFGNDLDKVTWNDISEYLKSLYDTEFMLDGVLCTVVQGRGRRPTMLQPAENERKN